MVEYKLTKQIAKHGKQGIIVVPKILENELAPGTLVELRIKIIKRNSEANTENNSEVTADE